MFLLHPLISGRKGAHDIESIMRKNRKKQERGEEVSEGKTVNRRHAASNCKQRERESNCHVIALGSAGPGRSGPHCYY